MPAATWTIIGAACQRDPGRALPANRWNAAAIIAPCRKGNVEDRVVRTGDALYPRLSVGIPRSGAYGTGGD